MPCTSAPPTPWSRLQQPLCRPSRCAGHPPAHPLRSRPPTHRTPSPPAQHTPALSVDPCPFFPQDHTCKKPSRIGHMDSIGGFGHSKRGDGEAGLEMGMRTMLDNMDRQAHQAGKLEVCGVSV